MGAFQRLSLAAPVCFSQGVANEEMAKVRALHQ